MVHHTYGSPWLAKCCAVMSGALLLSGYYYSNVRFVPLALGVGILAFVCGLRRADRVVAKPLTESGNFPAL